MLLRRIGILSHYIASNSCKNAIGLSKCRPDRQTLISGSTLSCTRNTSSDSGPKLKSVLADKSKYYMASIAVAMFGATFAAVPLYQLYCQVTGKGGQAIREEDEDKVVGMNVDKTREIRVRFESNTHSSMAWNFVPLQNEVIVHPGETALAFYRATNPLDELVIGVATYTVLPYEAGQYFNKIQCFCFEEQMLRPKEDVFMPVLFYIDPEYSKDPQLVGPDVVTLSYTFFRSKDGQILDLDEPIELKPHK